MLAIMAAAVEDLRPTEARSEGQRDLTELQQIRDAISDGSVETGHSSSEIQMSSFSWRPPAVGSDQTTTQFSLRVVCLSHSRRTCETRAIVGAANRLRCPSDTTCSAMRSEVNVFPVPHAMTRRLRSWLVSPSTASSMASA